MPRLRRHHRLTELLTPREKTSEQRTTDRTEKKMTRLDRALTHYSRTAARIDTAACTATTAALEALHSTCRQWEDEARTLGASPADLAAARRTATA
ncbi:hypothetical protein CH282_16010 [Rhodococcus sp. 06-418-1B]|nr:hypothetical protein [Rhodococcus sp. 06-418-1B]OZC83454.1 hypothetical protein CH282_16010 [Rhodococcus sp. 06-418-1B]